MIATTKRPARRGPYAVAPRTEPTARQMDVWHHICAGLTNKCIADAMGITIKTVIKHRCDLYRRLGAHCIAEVVLAGVRHGVVEL